MAVLTELIRPANGSSRHEALSRFFEVGLTTPEVASISGHRDPRMLFRYSHPMRQRVLEVIDRSEP